MSKIYCTYLTIYSGNKLPPFYIGYKNLKTLEKGYHGTVTSQMYKTIWEDELKNNPHLFKTKILTMHKNRDEAKLKETYFQKAFQVNKNPMYINRHISGETFINTKNSKETREKLSKAMKGKKHTDETRKKQSERKQGKNNHMYGKTHSKEAKDKISKIHKGKKLTLEHYNSMRNYMLTSNPFKGKTHTDDVRKLISEANKGRIPITNGVINKRIKSYDLNHYLTQGWVRGKT